MEVAEIVGLLKKKNFDLQLTKRKFDSIRKSVVYKYKISDATIHFQTCKQH